MNFLAQMQATGQATGPAPANSLNSEETGLTQETEPAVAETTPADPAVTGDQMGGTPVVPEVAVDVALPASPDAPAAADVPADADVPAAPVAADISAVAAEAATDSAVADIPAAINAAAEVLGTDAPVAADTAAIDVAATEDPAAADVPAEVPVAAEVNVPQAADADTTAAADPASL